MWATHWQRNRPDGRAWARRDWWLRYVLIATASFSWVLSPATGKPFAAPSLAWKVILFGGVPCAGIGIRYFICWACATWPCNWPDVFEPGAEVFMRQVAVAGYLRPVVALGTADHHRLAGSR